VKVKYKAQNIADSVGGAKNGSGHLVNYDN